MKGSVPTVTPYGFMNCPLPEPWIPQELAQAHAVPLQLNSRMSLLS